MPFSINGCGTAFIGKTNVRRHVWLCDRCKSNHYATDYTTKHYVTLFLVPIIPLGKTRIVNHCPVCDTGSQVPLEEWEQRKTLVIQQATRDLSDAKDDPERAIELMNLLATFGEDEEAIELASILVQQHQSDITALIEGGHFFESVGRVQDSEKCYQRACRLAPNHPKVLHLQAMKEFDAMNFEAAQMNLDAFHEAGGKLEPELVRVMIDGFQANGFSGNARCLKDRYSV